jgi:hypothetical protein
MPINKGGYMKYFFKLFLVLSCCLCLAPLNVSASKSNPSLNNIEKIGKSIYVDIKEIQEYAEIANLQEDFVRHMHMLVEKTKTEELPKSIKLDNIVKVMEVKDIQPSGLKLNLNRYQYRVPLIKDTGYIFSTLIIEDSKVISHESEMTYDTSLGQASYLFDSNLVENIISSVSKEVLDLSVMTIPTISTDFVYFTSENGAFVIPFSSRPDFLELENGKVYSYDVFAKKTIELLTRLKYEDGTSILRHRGSGGGGGYSSNITAIHASLIIILTIVILMISFLVVKKKIRKTISSLFSQKKRLQ